MFLFWAVLVVAFLELGFQKIVQNCVELCGHAEKLCRLHRVIVRNCADQGEGIRRYFCSAAGYLC